MLKTNKGVDDINHINHSFKAFLRIVRWSKTTVAARSKVMMKIADILESRLDELAQFESRDQGKPVSLAKVVDIPRAVYNFRFFATAILHHLDT